MKKSLIVSIVLAGVVLISGCGKQTATENKAGNSVGGAVTENKAGNLAGETAPIKDDGNLILDTADKIKEAMLGGKKMECSFKETAADGASAEMKMQSQGKKFRSSYVVNGETFISVSDGEVVYAWSSKTKEGTKMDIKCMEDLAKTVPQAKDAAGDKIESQDPETLVENTPGMNCVPVSEIDFSIPASVNFVDTCEQLKKVFESMKGLNANIPKGVGLPPITE